MPKVERKKEKKQKTLSYCKVSSDLEVYSSRVYKLWVFGSGKVKAEKLVEKQSVAKKL